MLKSFLFLCLGLSLAAHLAAQDISGDWYGVFRNPQGQPLRLQMTFEKNGEGWTGQMKSPDVTSEAISMNAVMAKGDTLRFSIDSIKFTYTGVWNITRNGYNGYFEQLGNRIPMNISHKVITADSILNDVQAPGNAIAYAEEEVKFVDKTDRVLITGTLSKPGVKRRFPAIVLAGPPGPYNRDVELLGHPVLAVLADYLTKHGMAVLRFDNRGIGGSTGRYDSATVYNFANDVEAAIQYLHTRKDIDSSFIGLLGYQEGAAAGQIVAARNPQLPFFVQMAAPGLEGRAIRIAKVKGDAAFAGASADEVNKIGAIYEQYLNVLVNEKDTATRRQKAYQLLNQIRAEDVVADMYDLDAQPQNVSLLTYDPAIYLARIKSPVLAVNGDMDIENNGTINLSAISRILADGGNKKVTIKSFPGLNHLFQYCSSCTADEYGTLSETINPAVLEFITRWVQLLY